MSFFLFLLQSITVLTIRVEWVYDYLIVPVFSNVEDFRYLPEAKIYIDDYLVDDALVTYERNGVEWTYISTVNTSHVRKYSMKYRAYFPRYNYYHVQTITFDVVDLSPPIVALYPDRQMYINEKVPDLLAGVVVSDNYNDPSEIVIICDTSKVVMNRVGEYTITYRATDTSGNQSYQEAVLRIIDPLPPEVTLIKPLILNVGADFDWKLFMQVKDNVDAFLTVMIYDEKVDYQQLGSYEIVIDVIDQSGNKTSQIFLLEVADLEAPEMWLKSKPPNILVHSEITDHLLQSYILSISDNVDDLTPLNVSIIHDIEVNVLGTYQITYTIKDQSNNSTSKTIKVSIVDDVKPTIEIVTPLIFDVYSREPLWLNHLQLSDNHNQPDELVCKITQSVKMNVIGSYLITIELIDKSSNKAIYQGYVDIVDRIPPSITQVSDALIVDFEKKDFKLYFSYDDQYDQPDDLAIEIDDSSVDYEHTGSYEAIVYATDSSGNQAFLHFEIMVIDMIEPELILKNTTLTLNIDDAMIDLRSLIESASDNYDFIGIPDVEIISSISEATIGKYEIIYRLSDQSKNVTEQILYVIIDDRIPPILTMDDLSITQNQMFNALEGVAAFDNVAVTEINIYPLHIDTSVPGTYVLTYVAFDARGNYTLHDRYLTILESDKKNTWDDFVPVVMILILGLGMIYILYKKQ